MTQSPVYSSSLHLDETFVLPATALPLDGRSVAQQPYLRQFYPETTTVWNTKFAIVDMPATVRLADDIIQARKPEYIVTANLNYLMLVERTPRLADFNRSAAAVIADGHPIVARSRLSAKPLPCRVAGADLIVELAKLSAERGYKMFFLGGAEGVAEKAAVALKARFPNLQMAGTYSPPYRQLSAVETDEMIERINQSGADILLVAFGQPKGELWIDEHLQKLNVPLNIQLGASFDFLAGTAKRAPWLFQRCGVEWLYRAACDPKRLVPRYSANVRFLLRTLCSELTSMFRKAD